MEEGNVLGKRALDNTAVQEGPKRKKSRKQRPGFDEEIFSETTYYIQNGLRYVKPYYFSFTSHAKGRWVGSRVYDIFCREFQAEKPEFYEKAIKVGKVTVNSELATMQTVLQHNDLLVHRVHRHEPPVTAQPLTIVHQDDDIIAINKPSSIPVHPCGRYRHNSVVFLLGKEHGLRNLHTIHRLDRLTSGLLLFARSLATAQQLELQIRERRVTKEYVAKVHGEFPIEPLECSEPILVVSHKLGVCRVDPAGKTCSTSFTRLSYNGHTSIVKCVPRTGRMHQIRVHLQWLGYPIVNDPLYGHSAWGPQRGRRGEGVRDMEQVISEIVESNYNSEAVATPTTTSANVHDSAHSSGSRLSAEREGSAENQSEIKTEDVQGESGVRLEGAGAIGSSSMQALQGPSGVCATSTRHSFVRDSAETGSSMKLCQTEEVAVSECTVSQSDSTEVLQKAERELEEEVGQKDTERGEEVEGGGLATVIEERSDREETNKECEEGAASLEFPAKENEGSGDCVRREALMAAPAEMEEHTRRDDPPVGKDKGTAGRSPKVLSDDGLSSGEVEGGVRDPDCTECGLVHPDPTPDQLLMYLHAVRYTGADWEYSTELPSWAKTESLLTSDLERSARVASQQED